MAALTYYNRIDAAHYARKYALEYNSAYPDVSSSTGGGGDCTNFVSQALRAGGWSMIYGPAHSLDRWWYKGKPTGSWWEHYISGYASNTWVSASEFSVFLEKSPRVSRCNESDLTIGDIVQARIISQDDVDHSMIVTMVGSDGVQVSYHTKNTLDSSLRGTKKRFGPDFDYLYWKVADIFFDIMPSDPMPGTGFHL